MTIFNPNERIIRFLVRLWTLVIIAVILLLVFKPELLSPEYLKEKLFINEDIMLPIYLGLLFIRVFLFIPQTPLLFLGFILFPDWKLVVIFPVMMSALLSAGFFYYFAGKSGWYEYFYKNYPIQTEKLERIMSTPKSVWIVILWSFLPLTPSDLISFTAGIVRMPFRILVIGTLIGQMPLMILYALIGDLLLSY